MTGRALEYWEDDSRRGRFSVSRSSTIEMHRAVEDAVFVEITEEAEPVHVGAGRADHPSSHSPDFMPHAQGSPSIRSGLALQAAHLYGTRMHEVVTAQRPGDHLLRIQQMYRDVSRIDAGR